MKVDILGLACDSSLLSPLFSLLPLSVFPLSPLSFHLSPPLSSRPRLGVDEDVLGLEVAVHDAAPVELRKGEHDLARVEGVGVGVEGRMVLQQIEELAAGEVVHDEVQPTLRANAQRLRMRIQTVRANGAH